MSTLIAYPDTLLGIMFSERNKEMVHPTNGNEYFFDRDGHLFRYILQYYRTGKVHWPEFLSPNQSENNSPVDKERRKSLSLTESAGVSGITPSLPFTRAELEQELLFFLIPTKSDDELIESSSSEESSTVT